VHVRPDHGETLKKRAISNPVQSARAPLPGFGRAMAAAAALLAGALACAAPALAAEWPTRTVTVVVPFPAGGNTDTMARMASEHMSRALGQPFVVDNRPAGGGIVGVAQVARSAPDGHTLFFGPAVQMVIRPILIKVNYDPVRDFTPVSIFGTGAFVLGVHESVPAKSFDEFLAHAKGRKDSLNVATAGPGGFSHLAAALLARRAGLDFTYVPYRGGAPATTALLAGDVAVYFGNGSELIPHVGGGRVRVLAVSTAAPMPQLPDTPTVASTFPGFDVSSWNGFFTPSATPQAVVEKMAAAMAAAARDPDNVKRLDSLGIEPVGSTPQEFAEVMSRELALYREAIEATGLPTGQAPQ